MERYIVSPKTGKDIIAGGPTYEKLLQTSYASAVKKAKVFEKGSRSSHQRQYGKTTKSLEVHMPKSPIKPKQGRGGKTVGWRIDAPKRGAERTALKHRCGDECFLKPESNGFPICAALRKGSSRACKVDCRGIITAKVRSGQWDYADVHKAAMELSKKYGC